MKLNKLALVALIAMAGCSKPAEAPKTDATATATANATNATPAPAGPTASASVTVDGIKIEHAMVRLPANGTSMTAAYVDLVNTNKTALTITGGTADIAKRLELHTHEKGANGMMQMRKVDSFELKTGEELRLAPGGKHIMLFDVKSDLKDGDTAHITLDTKEGKKLTFDAKVMNPPPMGDMPHDMKGMDHDDMKNMPPMGGMPPMDHDKH